MLSTVGMLAGLQQQGFILHQPRTPGVGTLVGPVGFCTKLSSAATGAAAEQRNQAQMLLGAHTCSHVKHTHHRHNLHAKEAQQPCRVDSVTLLVGKASGSDPTTQNLGNVG